MCVLNPFGNDDEDFQISNILDENLDVTFRSVSDDSDYFPLKLDAPKMIYASNQSGIQNVSDNLETFLDELVCNSSYPCIEHETIV